MLPPEVTTCALTFGKSYNILGEGATVEVTIKPSHHLTWVATGDQIPAFHVSSSVEKGVIGQLDLPHTDQAGFMNWLGKAFTNWHYVADIVTRLGSQSVMDRKVFSLASGQETVDLDLLPSEGQVSAPGIATMPEVLTVNRQTGNVEIAVLPEGGEPGQIPVRTEDGVEWGAGGGGATDESVQTLIDDPESATRASLLGTIGSAISEDETVAQAAASAVIVAVEDLDVVVAGTETAQADYVATLATLSDYAAVEITKRTESNALTVACVAPSGKKVSYEITSASRYQYVGAVEASGDAIDLIAQDWAITDLATSVTFLALTTSPYTTTVGATFEAQVTTGAPDAVVNFRRFQDSRGGVWRLSIAENPTITADVTTWNSTAAILATDVLTIPDPGTWTIRGEFLGNDPAQSYSGASRGWVGSVNGAEPRTLTVTNVVPEDGTVTTVPLSPLSNKDFAIKIRQAGVGDYEFVPYHGTDSEAFASPTRYYADGARLDVASMAVGDTVAATSFEVIQHIYGRNSTASDPATNLVEVWTKQRISANGTYTVSGRWKALANIEADWSSYHPMLTALMPLFDQVISSVRTVYPISPAQAPLPALWLAQESDDTDGYALISSTSDYVAAMRFDNRRETLRVGAPDKRDANRRGFIELRDGGGMVKIYNSVFAAGAAIPAGAIHRFAATYFYGEVPGIYGTLALA